MHTFGSNSNKQLSICTLCILKFLSFTTLNFHSLDPLETKCVRSKARNFRLDCFLDFSAGLTTSFVYDLGQINHLLMLEFLYLSGGDGNI